MKAIIAISILMLLAGCAGPNLEGQCWNRAIYAYGAALADGHEARIIIQETPRSGEGIYHAQAQALIGGEWRWLQVYG